MIELMKEQGIEKKFDFDGRYVSSFRKYYIEKRKKDRNFWILTWKLKPLNDVQRFSGRPTNENVGPNSVALEKNATLPRSATLSGQSRFSLMHETMNEDDSLHE